MGLIGAAEAAPVEVYSRDHNFFLTVEDNGGLRTAFIGTVRPSHQQNA
jgi:hypothetical protein